MSTTEYQKLTCELKRVLKERGTTYAALAQQLGMSEANIKKILSKSDGKVSTLNQICECMGFTFFELAHWSNSPTIELTYITEEQEAFFIENFEYYKFFCELVIQKKSVPEIQRDHRLNGQSIRAYISGLEQIGIVFVWPDGSLRINLKEPIAMKRSGKLRALVQEKFAHSVIANQFDYAVEPNSKRLETRDWLLRREDFERLYMELTELIVRYDQIAARDHAVTKRSELISVSLVLAALLHQSAYPSIANLKG